MDRTDSNRILILGIGNYLMGDEGIGVHAARRLEAGKLPPGIEVLDGGTGGFHLLSYLENYETIILVDATLDHHSPGTIRLIRPRFTRDFPNAMSTHDIGLKDMMSALQLLGKMPDIHLFVVSIKSIQQQGITLSPEIEKVMPDLMDKINKLVSQLSAEEGTLILQDASPV